MLVQLNLSGRVMIDAVTKCVAEVAEVQAAHESAAVSLTLTSNDNDRGLGVLALLSPQESRLLAAALTEAAATLERGQ